jgi:cytosine/adenosine deaminase-related metal-dependent hydrolase
MIETLTYDALGARLAISPEAARAVARRLRLPRSRSGGGKILVAVDVDELVQRRQARAARTTRMGALQAEVARLAATLATHRADFERERERADRLAAELARLTAETRSVKDTTTALEGEVAALRIGLRKEAPGRLASLAASVVAADRTACR